MTQRKAIFITGGGSGIGRAIARHFGTRGWFIGLGDIDENGMSATEALLPGGYSYATRLDVRDAEDWARALEAFSIAAGGRIDVVASNAGVGHAGAITELSEREIDQLIAVNFRGAVNGARAAYPHLIKTAPGSCLLNTASASALYGTGGLSVYSATKFAVRAITEALDTEWHDEGIKVRSIMPSFVDTPILAGPANTHSNQSKRDTVVAAGMEFTPVEDVAQAAWDAVHGRRIHTVIGKTARIMRLAAMFAPFYVRNRARRLMAVRLGRG